MNGHAYREFNASDYTTLRKSLIGGRGESRASRQRAFLEQVLDSSEFVSLLETELQIEGARDVEPLADRMTEAEFKDPPPDTEQRLFEGWADLKPRVACRTPFWGYVTWRHIKEGRIESSFLAANGNSPLSGAGRLEKAVAAAGEEAMKSLDSAVRDVLRRLGGLPEARGNRTVYVNCPLARGWWRERFVNEASGDDSEVAARVRRVVRVNQEYWERLVTYVVSRNSVFGSPEVRAALVRSIGDRLSADPQSPLRSTKEFLIPACRTLSTVQASRDLSVLPNANTEAVVRDVVALHLDSLRGRSGVTS